MTKLLGAASALFLGMGVAMTPAHAFEIEGTGLTVGVTPTISSDYLFRGVSQTRNRPAAQVTLDVAHESGFYVGAFASNVSFAGLDARQEIDALAGYRFTLGPVSLDVGGIYYTYPGYDKPAGGLDLNYFEVAAKASLDLSAINVAPVKLLGSVFWSPDFQAQSGNAWYAEAGVEVTLPYDFTLAGRYGYQWINRNDRFGTPDFANWSATVSHTIQGFVLTVGYYDTNIDKRSCVGGQKICDARAMVTLSRTF